MPSILNYKKFFIWWASVLAMGTGVFWANHFGVIQKIWETDGTMITSLIASIFLGANLLLGWIAWKLSNASYVLMHYDELKRKLNSVWFISEQLMALGMFGTVVGLIMMLSQNLITSADAGVVTDTLGTMWSHMGLALYTNAVGLITSIILKIQAYYIGYEFDET